MSTKERKAEVKPRSRSLLVIAAFYALVGLADLTILFTSRFMLIYIGFLGALNLAAAVGLWLLKKWGLYLAYVGALLGGFAGLITVYASVMFSGSFNPNAYGLTLNSVLISYAIAVVIAVLYLFRQKREFS